MAERVIPLVDERTLAPRTPWPVPPVATGNHAPLTLSQGMLLDSLQRPLRDLRISVTDRCNFRCSYCMPKEVFDKNYQYLPQKALLSFEEITRLARSFLALGVHKIRLTGGEPLLRKNLDVLIKQLAGLQTVDGTPPELTLTTNGALLKRQAKTLKTAGLQRITVSLDALDDALFQRMNDADFPVADVLTGIEAAQTAGLPVKVNMVVKRGTNEQQILPMARHFRGSGVVLRFIEYMDVGATNGWQMAEVLPSAELIARLQAELPLIPLAASAPGETAARWGYADTQGRHDSHQGEIGAISSVTQAFCHECNRARLSTEGQLFLCLFASQGWDLRSLLRQGANEQEIRQAIATIWSGRSDRYSELRSQLPQDVATAPQGGRNRRVEMSYIGG